MWDRLRGKFLPGKAQVLLNTLCIQNGSATQYDVNFTESYFIFQKIIIIDYNTINISYLTRTKYKYKIFGYKE